MAALKRNHNKKHMCVSCGVVFGKFTSHAPACRGSEMSGSELLVKENERVESMRLISYSAKDLEHEYGNDWPRFAYAYVKLGVPVRVGKKALYTLTQLSDYLQQENLGSLVRSVEGQLNFLPGTERNTIHNPGSQDIVSEVDSKPVLDPLPSQSDDTNDNSPPIIRSKQKRKRIIEPSPEFVTSTHSKVRKPDSSSPSTTRSKTRTVNTVKYGAENDHKETGLKGLRAKLARRMLLGYSDSESDSDSEEEVENPSDTFDLGLSKDDIIIRNIDAMYARLHNNRVKASATVSFASEEPSSSGILNLENVRSYSPASSVSFNSSSDSKLMNGTVVMNRHKFIRTFWPNIDTETKTPTAAEYIQLANENPMYGLGTHDVDRKKFQDTFLAVVNKKRAIEIVRIVGRQTLSDPEATLTSLLNERKWMTKKVLSQCCKLYKQNLPL